MKRWKRQNGSRSWAPRALALAAIGAAVAWGVAAPDHARSQDSNFAGSLQGSYVAVPTDMDNARDLGFDGFITEMTLKLAVDFTDHVSANIKVCYACHGFEVDMAFLDLRVADELNFRVGRFNPAFGDFPLRHDPANHRTINKPLPYDMGRMLRRIEWNNSVLPSPYVDNGLEINGTHWFGETVQLDYAAYVVSGLKGTLADTDIDFVESRTPSFYYVDNNSVPSIGGRLAFTLDLTLDVAMTFGASFTHGAYSGDRDLEYTILGSDFYARLGALNLRAEYLVRSTEMRLGDDPGSRFKYGPGANGRYSDYFLKEGFYVQADYPLSTNFELVGRFDGMRRLGNVLATSPLRSQSLLLRYTGGFNLVIERSVRLKVFGEFYDFSDFDDEVALSTALVAVF